MDFTNNVQNNEDVDKKSRTLWVGNLHPKVSNKNIAELFFQVGPIEYVEFAYDEREVCENFAWVVFKYPSSVEDSINLLRDTKLYGMPIITKKYSKHLEDPVFNDQLNYFKQLVNVERSSQSNENKSRWNDQSLDNKNCIPDSLPEPPMYGKYNSNQDNYGHRSESSSRHSFKEDSFNSKYHQSNSYSKRHNDYSSESYYSRGSFKKMEHNSSSRYINDKGSYHNQNYDRKHRDYNSHSSPTCTDNNYYNQEQLYINKNNSVKDVGPVRDLRVTMNRKCNVLNSDHPNATNAACTSQLDLRDTMHHSKGNKFKDTDSNSHGRWSGRNNKNIHGESSFIDKQSRKNSYVSDRYDESNIKYQKYHDDQEYHDQSFSQDKSYDTYQKYDNEYSNSYRDRCSQERNRSNNYKQNHARSQNMASGSRQYNSYHPYKHNESNEKKEYNNSYDDRSGHSQGRSYNKGSFDRSRQSHYS